MHKKQLRQHRWLEQLNRKRRQRRGARAGGWDQLPAILAPLLRAAVSGPESEGLREPMPPASV